MNLRIGQFLIGHMLEDLGREYKIECVVRPWDLGHGRIFGPVAGCRVETEALAVARRELRARARAHTRALAVLDRKLDRDLAYDALANSHSIGEPPDYNTATPPMTRHLTAAPSAVIVPVLLRFACWGFLRRRSRSRRGPKATWRVASAIVNRDRAHERAGCRIGGVDLAGRKAEITEQCVAAELDRHWPGPRNLSADTPRLSGFVSRIQRDKKACVDGRGTLGYGPASRSRGRSITARRQHLGCYSVRRARRSVHTQRSRDSGVQSGHRRDWLKVRLEPFHA